MSNEALFNSALALPEQLRADLAAQLLDSLAPSKPVDAASDDYAEEVKRRSDEIDRGEVQTVPWEEARKLIRASLGGENSS